ncbi:ADP-ribosylation factor 2 [Pelomyxa schiedti]|nr:ADP-ribosylation factor 2 [Pelomyxa schiedti]
MGTVLVKLWRFEFTRKNMKIVVLGLNGAGKTTILRQLQMGEIATTTHGGGFEVETVAFRSLTFNAWDVSNENVTMLWRQYFQNTQGIIFVVDTTDRPRITEACDALRRILAEDGLRNAGLLIFANKQDMANVMSVAEITQKLDLNSLRNRRWCKLGQRFQDKLRGWLYALRLQLEYEATNIISWRTFVMGPLTEEIVFRGCMIPILCASGLSIQAACFMSPLVFGLAHVHHGIQRVVTKKAPILEVILGTIVQLTYTTIFGAYTSFILIRTGNLYACILAHSFCNVMGLPPFQEAIEHKYRFLICTSFVIGLVGFFLLLFPLTNPLWYSSVFVELLEGRPI